MINRRWDAWRRRRALAYLALTPEQRVRRHQIRQIGVLITLPGLVLGGAGLATAYGTGLFGIDKEPVCAPTVVAAPKRGSFDLHIQNATGVGGRATEIAKELERREFKIVDATTANENLYVRSAAVIYYGASGLDQALLVQSQVPGARIQNDGRKGTTINLIIGSGYKGLVPGPPIEMPRPEEITVNVYNATWREGLAKTVQTQLTQRDFKKGKTGNDPDMIYLPEDTAVIRHNSEDLLAAKRLLQHVPNAKLVEKALPEGQLELVIGNKFTTLTQTADVPALPPPPKPIQETVARPCS